MPEGDSLARVERQLSPVLLGQTILRSQLRVPALATVDLSGRTVTDVSAYGKHLFLQFDGGDLLHSHLKMEGAWKVVDAGATWGVQPSRVRAVLETAGHTILGIDLGTLEAITPSSRAELENRLGPDPLHRWDEEEALGRLQILPERGIGLALLDQQLIAGLGNVFRSEVLFLSRLHPERTVGSLSEDGLRAVVQLSARQLVENAARPSRRTTPATSRERYYVYGRTGRMCVRGHARISHGTLADPELQRGWVGGDSQRLDAVAREVFWCPSCQATPNAAR